MKIMVQYALQKSYLFSILMYEYMDLSMMADQFLVDSPHYHGHNRALQGNLCIFRLGMSRHLTLILCETKHICGPMCLLTLFLTLEGY